MKRSLQQYGQIVPIIVDPSGTIVDGHLVWEAMKELGLPTISAVRAEGRSAVEIKGLRHALNRLPQDSRWDNVALKEEFTQLMALSFDMELTMFEAAEIDAVLKLDLPEANVADDEDAIPGVPEMAISKKGDMWVLKNHRILCGDALSADDLTMLMAGEAARMVISDPPYNVPIDGFVSGLGKIRHREFAQASGEMSDKQFTDFLTSAVSIMASNACDGALLYLFMDWRHTWNLLEAGRGNQLELVNLSVWVKNNAGMGGLYRSQHELVLIFKSGTAPHYNNVELGKHGRSRSNVWSYRGLSSFSADRNELLSAHPTVKPVSLLSDAIRDVTKRGDIVLDTFLGSGSTLIAAEETGRVCRGLEIDPLYVDVAIRRWQKLTGRDAVHAVTGATFDEVCERQSQKEVAHG